MNHSEPSHELQVPRARALTPIDRLLDAAQSAMASVWGHPVSVRDYPGAHAPDATLSEDERREAGALMRVNHVGEVCAQALYSAQSIATSDPQLQRHFDAAARDELDHLAWTRRRLDELGDRPSLLNPLWYAGSFAIGLLAARFGDRASLGFVIETERQVEQHLQGHLQRLPAADAASRAVVTQMRDDESRHALQAELAGGHAPIAPVRALMRLAAKVMTTTAHRL
jgi:3-demethoxyubiquinol 3-hydroxylase